MAKGKKKGTPEGIDELLKRREVIGEDAYTEYWRRLNRARKESGAAFEAEGRRILKELRQDIGIFKSKQDAEAYKSEFGGRIIRRDARGRFSKRGRTFQVIGGDHV